MVPKTTTVRVAARQKADRSEVLHQQQAHAPRGCDQQVAQGAVAGLAGDRIARGDADREREEERNRDRERGERDEQPVVR